MNKEKFEIFNKKSNLQRYSVKIINRKHGSGILNIPKNGEYAYIFTVAHVVEIYLTRGEEPAFFTNLGEVKYEKGSLNKCYIFNTNEYGNYNVDYYDEEYCGSSKDIIVFQIDKKFFPEGVLIYDEIRYVVEGNVRTRIGFGGFGFPNNSETKVELFGTIDEWKENDKLFICTSEKVVESYVDAMKGYSGTGLFIEINNRLAVVGLVVSCNQHEKHMRFYAVGLKEIIEKIGLLNWEVLREESENSTSDDGPINKHSDKVVLIPFSSNNYFVGRSEQLERLHNIFVENKSTMPTIQTIQGLGGIGKTQLALKYAYEHLETYDTICWIECKTEESIKKSWCEFLSVIGEDTIEVSRFVHWFQFHSNWLLVFDDINESASVEHLIPKLGDGHIIKTTQISKGKQMHDFIIPLDIMSKEESVSFLVMCTNDNNKKAAEAIAKRLGRLPLALEQATAYINELDSNLTEYLQLLCKHDLSVFDSNKSVKNYNWNVKTVWNITLERLSDHAKRILYCFAYMSADILALDLLVEHANELHVEREKPDEFIDQIGKDGKPTGVKVNITEIFREFTVSKFTPKLITILADNIERNRAIIELKKFSLIKSKNDKTLKMHSLLQEVIRNGITDHVYLLSVAEVMKKKCNEFNLIFNDYHMALPMEQAKSIILNIKTLLKYEEEYTVSLDKVNIDMRGLQFDFYSFIAQYLTLRGISENDINFLEDADRCFITACEIGLPLYGGGEDSHLLGTHTFTVIQEKHRRMRVNLILNRIDVARKLYAEIRKPVYKVLKQEVHMSFHAFTNFGDLWSEFGYYDEAKECYEYALELDIKDEILMLRTKIAECEKSLAVITSS